jgi:hypothetical protein
VNINEIDFKYLTKLKKHTEMKTPIVSKNIFVECGSDVSIEMAVKLRLNLSKGLCARFPFHKIYYRCPVEVP